MPRSGHFAAIEYTWKWSRYLVVQPDEPGAKENAPDGKAVALLAILVD